MALNFHTDVTNGDPDGSGVFDTMMKSVTAHLEKQYMESRIRDEDYATVYLGAIEASMAQSVQFVIGKEQAETAALLALSQRDLTEAELDLVRQKTETEKAQTEEVDDGILGAQQDLLAKDLLIKDQDILNSVQQVAKSVAEVSLIEEKVITEEGNNQNKLTGLVGKQQALLDQDILVKQQNVLESIEKVALVKEQVKSEEGNNENRTKGLIGRQQALLLKQTAKEHEHAAFRRNEVYYQTHDMSGYSYNTGTGTFTFGAGTIGAEQGGTKANAVKIGAEAGMLAIRKKYMDIDVPGFDYDLSTGEVTLGAGTVGAEQGTAKANALKSIAEARLLDLKGATEKAQTEDATGGLMLQQLTSAKAAAIKTHAEGVLIIQKAITEQAQTLDSTSPITIPASDGDIEVGETGDVAGMVGAQKEVYTAQTKGFADDYKVKVAKLYTNAYQVQKAAQPDSTKLPPAFAADNISSYIQSITP